LFRRQRLMCGGRRSGRWRPWSAQPLRGREASAPLPALGFNDEWAPTARASTRTGPVPARQGDRGEGGAAFPSAGHGGGGRQQAHRILPPAARKTAALRRRLSPAHRKQGVCTNDPPAANANRPPAGGRPRSAPVYRLCGPLQDPIVADGAAANRAWSGFVENVADR